ncbi:ChbG/HpnK family deacetylase [Viridibacillus arvi]|uniref:ChbG/HpnK family deacetylase n=1 Tax=Viridibacillus arvi TaxID=263475 RepID=UPI0034CF1D36
MKSIKQRGVSNIQKLIITADDFGISSAVNKGILECAHNKAITGTSVMANGILEGIKEIQALNYMAIGVHLNLTHLEPISNNFPPSLLTENGRFQYWFIVDGKPVYSIEDDVLEEEYIAQIERVGNITEIHYLDHHHHLHQSEKCFNVITKVAKKYKLPVRAVTDSLGEQLRRVEIPSVDTCVLDFFGENGNESTLKEALLKTKFERIELVTHPGISSDIDDNDDYDKKYRDMERKILTDKKVRNWIAQNYELISYKDIRKEFI